MTVSTSTSRISYDGNGVTASFPVPFPFIQDDYLVVIRTVIATGAETILTLDSIGADGYSVNGAGGPSGNVVVVTAPTALERLSIIRSVDATQEADFVANDPLPSEVIEDSLDKLTMLFGDIAGAEGLSRVPKLYAGDIDGSGRYNSNGNRYANAADGVSATDLATVQQITSAGSGSFVQAGTGSVIRTMQDKAREIVSVLDFGATGDGVTDDTIAIQYAMDSVKQSVGSFDVQINSRGGTVYFPPGAYRVTSTINGRAGTKMLGAGPNRSRIVSEIPSGNVVSFIGVDAGAVDPVEIEEIAVVQAFGFAHASGYAISIEGNSFGTTPRLRNVMTQDTYGGVFLDWCFPGSLDNVHCFRHAIEGFRTTFNCTSITFQNCYAGANAGSGFKIAGNYISLVNCASDSNTLDGYELYFDAGASTGISLVSCGTEACSRNGIASDRIASLSVIAPRVIVGAAGISALKLDGGDAISVASPVLSAVSANANPCIDISNASGLFPNSVTIIGWSGTTTNYATNINNTDQVYWVGGRVIASLANGVLRLGNATNFTAAQQSMAFGQNFPAQVGGATYGTNHLPVLTGTVTTLAVSYRLKPIVNAPTFTIARFVAGMFVEAPTVTAGTVTRYEGLRVADMPAGSSADAGLVVGDATVPVGRWSIFNGSTRKSLFAAGIQWGTSSGPQDLFGTGTPEGAVTAVVGSTFRRTDGGAATSFYVKESGTGNTGWVGK